MITGAFDEENPRHLLRVSEREVVYLHHRYTPDFRFREAIARTADTGHWPCELRDDLPGIEAALEDLLEKLEGTVMAANFGAAAMAVLESGSDRQREFVARTSLFTAASDWTSRVRDLLPSTPPSTRTRLENALRRWGRTPPQADRE